MRQGNVYRRRQIESAKRRGEPFVERAIAPVLQARFKVLTRDLRKGNLRHRLKKNDGALYKAGEYPDTWTGWSAYFRDTLRKSVLTGAGYLWTAEQKYFASYGYDGLRVDMPDVVSNYMQRGDTRIKDIPASTEAAVNRAITDWYNTDAGLPDLIDILSQWFSPERAALIATTEMGYVASTISLKQMKEYGIDKWRWDAFRDGVTCPTCFELMEQSIKVPFGIHDDTPPEHPNCVIPGQVVAVPNLSGGAKSFYSGIVIEITTVSGNKLTVTPNHPVLTSRGWLTANLIAEGTDVIGHIDPQGMLQATDPNNQQRPALVEDVFASLKMTAGMISETMKPSTKDFNGDALGIKGEVNIVYPNRELGYRMQASESKQITKVGFGGVHSPGFLNALSVPDFLVQGEHPTTSRIMGRTNLQGTLLGSHLAPLHQLRFALSTARDVIFSQDALDDLSVNSPFLGEFVFRNAGLIKRDKVVGIRKYDFSGHVFDLSSDFYELYTCNSIITHNCRCGMYYVGVDIQP